MSAMLFCFCSLTSVRAEMQALEDDFLSSVSGQSGITLDLEADVGVAEIAYFEDGEGIALQGVRFGAADASQTYAEFRLGLDILSDGALAFSVNSKNTARFEFEELRFVDAIGVAPLADAPSIGGVFFDFNLDGTATVRNTGNGVVSATGALGGVFDIDMLVSNGRLGYRTNGNEFFLDGMTIDIDSPGTVLGATPGGELILELPAFLAELSVDAIRYSNNPANHGVTTDSSSGAELPSYGSLWARVDMNSVWRVLAGGRDNSEGLTINSETTINRLDVAYGDDTDFAASGYWAGLLGVSGQVDITNLTVDVVDDPDAGVEPSKDYGLGLALQFDRIAANLLVEDVVLGETKADIDAYLSGSGAINSLGGLGVNLVLADAVFRGQSYTNRVVLQSGGNLDAGYQGLRLDTQLALYSDNNESNFIFYDDGNALMFSRLEGFVDGDLTLDVTAAGNLNGVDFYDGLRLGFEDLDLGYQIEGFRVAEDSGDQDAIKSAQLQSAQSLPGSYGGSFGLFGAPSLVGTLNGHITMGPGGNVGAEGVTINADLSLTQGEMARYIEADGSGKGLWLSGLDYDIHLRDMMLDVTDEGLRIYETESWTMMDVTDFRIGDRQTGASFGRLALETYEQGSVTTLSAGGAGQVCVGGAGVDQSSCESDGGRWDDRGSEGITLSTQRFFAQSIEAEGKRNRFTWETGRTGEGTAAVVNGSGMQLVFDNFSTNDGDGLNDTYGLRTDYQIDVSKAYVVKKEDGADSNGVVGDKGSIKVMNSDGSYQYVNPSDLTAQNLADLPVGIATRTRTHFKELDFGSVDLVHPVGGESTLLYGLKIQNLDMTTDITTTVLD